MKKLGKITGINILASALIILAGAFIIGVLAKNSLFVNFIRDAENKTFDYRQEIVSKKRSTFLGKENISIVAIDDVSFEYLWDKYGEWPIPRGVYADLIDYIEHFQPKSIVFDLFFIKSLKSSSIEDLKLINTVKKYDNVYLAMNFDNIPTEARAPQDLPKELSVKVEKSAKSKVSLKNMTFTNCRTILSGLLDNANVGMANVNRSTDGIIRTVSPFAYYKGEYYPYLSLLAADRYLNDKPTTVYQINDKSELVLADRKIPLTNF